jgi:hypothetical protein
MTAATPAAVLGPDKEDPGHSTPSSADDTTSSASTKTAPLQPSPPAKNDESPQPPPEEGDGPATDTAAAAAAGGAAPEEARTRLQTTVIMLALASALFLAALDVTIVTVAIPTIAQEFNSTAGYTWIGSAYMLATAAAAPMWGKISDIWGRKPVLLIAVAVFWVGSLLSAVSVSMGMLIVARAVQGVGGGGIVILVNVCISDLFSMRKRGELSLFLVLTVGVVVDSDSRGVLWCHGHGVGRGFGGWAGPGRRLHQRGDVAVVLLHQPAHLGRRHGRAGVCA